MVFDVLFFGDGILFFVALLRFTLQEVSTHQVNKEDEEVWTAKNILPRAGSDCKGGKAIAVFSCNHELTALSKSVVFISCHHTGNTWEAKQLLMPMS